MSKKDVVRTAGGPGFRSTTCSTFAPLSLDFDAVAVLCAGQMREPLDGSSFVVDRSVKGARIACGIDEDECCLGQLGTAERGSSYVIAVLLQ